ncbi:DUF1266 domain-containing protein [Deinococcus koreensis]|nr:DUF1266 domain-containing protein [Deinococcus koreensis]
MPIWPFSRREKRAEALSPDQRWALAATALYTELNEGYHDRLIPIAGFDVKAERESVQEMWGIEGADHAVPALDWLVSEGHRGTILSETGREGTAWDLVRVINLSRILYGAGYLTEAQAWASMIQAARSLRATYSSWGEMGEAFLHGRDWWAKGRSAAFQTAHVRLLDPQNADSPWNQVAWNSMEPAVSAAEWRSN